MNIQFQEVSYRDGETELTGFLVAKPGQNRKSPGILVVHGGAGLDSHAKSRAARLAELGFVVFTCDMYGNGVAGDRKRVMARIAELTQDTGKLCSCATAGIRVLAAHPSVDGRIAAVGYCFGGMTVLELARSGVDLFGVVSVHGSLRTSSPAKPGVIKARILVCHGALDPYVPMPQVAEFIDEMKHARADWQLIAYGGATHGFTHEAPSEQPGVAYHALTDMRCASAIEIFLRELFGSEANLVSQGSARGD